MVCVEHLMNWTIAVSTMNYTAETVISFFEGHILRTIGPPNAIVSDNA